MTREEHAAILTGLRLLQTAIIEHREPTGLSGDSLMDILTCGGEVTPISAEQINALCMRINTRKLENW